MLRPNWNSESGKSLERTYEVSVGHARVRVRGASRDEAIAEARAQLCLDLPRMWDVIHSLEMQRFEVRVIENN